MTPQLVKIWRSPIKGHGNEALESVTLTEGTTLPWDRTWAVAHEGARLKGDDWVPCANFSRGAKAPSLMAISSQFEEASGTISLKHPELPDLTFNPDTDSAEFIEWVKPIMPENRAQSVQIVRAKDRGMTDTDFASISINNVASHRAVEQRLGTELDISRWRGNLIVDGFALWEEFEWVGKTVQIGNARLHIEEPITRCLATTANPETGERDADTLGALKTWNHQEFGVYGVVTQGGTITVGDAVTVH